MTRAFTQGPTKSGKSEVTSVFIPSDQAELLINQLTAALEAGLEEGVKLSLFTMQRQSDGKPYIKINASALIPGKKPFQRQAPAEGAKPRVGAAVGGFQSKRPFIPGR